MPKLYRFEYGNRVDCDIEYSVFQAMPEYAENNTVILPVNEWLILEYLESDMDGIFPTREEWDALYNELNQYGLDTETLNKYCYDTDTYSDKFAVHVGGGLWVKINPRDLFFEFDTNIYKDSIEILVKATIKDAE